MARAANSFPVPDSPVSRTGTSPCAAKSHASKDFLHRHRYARSFAEMKSLDRACSSRHLDFFFG